MSKNKPNKRATNQAPALDETAEQRRARQIKEWEERKKLKERRKSSGSPLLWLGSAAGALALTIVGAVILLQGGGSDSGAAATPVLDSRVAGLPVSQEVEIVADDLGQANSPTFDPTFVSGKAGEVIEFTLVNEGSVAHNLTVSGTDKEYGTPDDFTMDSLNAGEQGTLRVKIDEPGTYPFRCDLHPLQQVGNLALN